MITWKIGTSLSPFVALEPRKVLEQDELCWDLLALQEEEEDGLSRCRSNHHRHRILYSLVYSNWIWFSHSCGLSLSPAAGRPTVALV